MTFRLWRCFTCPSNNSFTHISHKSKGCRSWWIESQIFQKVKVLQYSEKETWRNLVSLLVRFQYFQAVCPIFSIWRLKYKPFRLRMWTQRSFQSCLETSEGLKSVMKLYKVNTDAPQLFGIFPNLTRNRNLGQVIEERRVICQEEEKQEK